jgi:hypothetical protein
MSTRRLACQRARRGSLSSSTFGQKGESYPRVREREREGTNGAGGPRQTETRTSTRHCNRPCGARCRKGHLQSLYLLVPHCPSRHLAHLLSVHLSSQNLFSQKPSSEGATSPLLLIVSWQDILARPFWSILQPIAPRTLCRRTS